MSLIEINPQITQSVKTKPYKKSTEADSVTIFVRRWHPETLQLDKFQEIILNSKDQTHTNIFVL